MDGAQVSVDEEILEQLLAPFYRPETALIDSRNSNSVNIFRALRH